MPTAHPIVFVLIGLVAAANLGLIAYLVHLFGDNYPAMGDASPNRVRSIMILLLFNASWTVLFAWGFVFFVFSGTMAFFAGITASLAWLIVTIILWAVGAAMFNQIRPGGECIGSPTVSLCRQLLAVEAMSWTILGLLIIALLTGIFAWRSNRRVRNGSYRV